jgi:hypothetical protein
VRKSFATAWREASRRRPRDAAERARSRVISIRERTWAVRGAAVGLGDARAKRAINELGNTISAGVVGARVTARRLGNRILGPAA